jgi:hypothetical protein
MESRTATLDVPAEDWAEVERWSLRAQALAELRALSWRDLEPGAAGAGSHLPRAIVLP